MSQAAAPTKESVFSPLKYPTFRWLWVGVTVAGMGNWAQNVGAQWLFVDARNAPTIVSLVQAANVLPVLLLALPAGVIADSFGRRTVMMWSQLYLVVVTLGLAALAFWGQVHPGGLIGFTLLIGAGGAILGPTWAALIPDLVPRTEIGPAARLDQVAVNVARAAGPAIAGFIIGWFGVPWAFVFNALCILAMIVLLVVTRTSDDKARPSQPERFLPALRAGGRFARHDPVVRRILLRLVLFVSAANAVWALLPIMAAHHYGVPASGYGLLFAAMGTGAITGALVVGGVKQRIGSNNVVIFASLLFAAGLALSVTTHSFVVGLVCLLFTGFGWTATCTMFIGDMQVHLPGWVRARGMAFYIMAFVAATAASSPLWGQVTERIGVQRAVHLASLLVAVVALTGIVHKLPAVVSANRESIDYWTGADQELSAWIPDQAGPVAVVVEFVVDEADQPAFLQAMRRLRISRLRSGATKWSLQRVGEESNRFVETFEVPTWGEHVRQGQSRLSAEDQAIEQRALNFSSVPPTARHLLPATTVFGDAHSARSGPNHPGANHGQ